ncbi:MAG: hypothetical protein ACI9MR_001518 [Myxococcota bacterium]|jgi:hypothetical protein
MTPVTRRGNPAYKLGDTLVDPFVDTGPALEAVTYSGGQ